MITFNIIGSCVCRDIFRICETDQFSVNKFYQFSSPISFCESPPVNNRLDISELEIYSEYSNFYKKTICADINKTVLSAIEDSPSDYMIIDLCELRFNILKVILAEDKFYITEAKSQSIFGKDSKIDRFKNAQIERTVLSEEQVEHALDIFISKLKSIYDSDRIILLKNLPVDLHINDENKSIYYYNNSYINDLRNRLNRYYDYFIKKIENIHIVEMPLNAIGNVNHKWGRDPLHFIDDVYEYLFNAIKIIAKNMSNECEMLSSLREIYTKYFTVLLKQKKLEYICKPTHDDIKYLVDVCFDQTENHMVGWNIFCATGAIYDNKTCCLMTDARQSTYAVLSYKFDIKKWGGVDVTLSLEYETNENSSVNVAIRFLDKSGNYKYGLVGNFMNLNREGKQIKSVIGKLPMGVDEVELKVYLNKPNQKVKLYRVAIELGKQCSLY